MQNIYKHSSLFHKFYFVPLGIMFALIGGLGNGCQHKESAKDKVSPKEVITNEALCDYSAEEIELALKTDSERKNILNAFGLEKFISKSMTAYLYSPNWTLSESKHVLLVVNDNFESNVFFLAKNHNGWRISDKKENLKDLELVRPSPIYTNWVILRYKCAWGTGGGQYTDEWYLFDPTHVLKVLDYGTRGYRIGWSDVDFTYDLENLELLKKESEFHLNLQFVVYNESGFQEHGRLHFVWNSNRNVFDYINSDSTWTLAKLKSLSNGPPKEVMKYFPKLKADEFE